MVAITTTGAGAQTRVTIRPGIAITPATPANPQIGYAEEDQPLQLEVFINGRSTGLVAAFTLHPSGNLSSPAAELDTVGLEVPREVPLKASEVPLEDLRGVTYRYDEAEQAIHFTAMAAAQKPSRVSGQDVTPSRSSPERPPLGAIVNYTLFASADNGPGGPRFEGLSGSFDTRVFGKFGVIENSFVARLWNNAHVTRLDSSYIYEDPERLITIQAGDLISGGFSWTRPVRLGGLQIRRSFGLRPDLITIPLPTFSGSAAAPSTLDLFVNKVRTLSATVPQGPYEIDHPPVIYGSGQARIVLRDALGRETVSTSTFYASPELLARGLTDFSAEVGFPRRNYASLSNDYDRRPAISASYRRGLTSGLTLQGHAEGVGRLASLGGSAIFTLGSFGLVSGAVAGSRSPGNSGGLTELTFESRSPWFSLMLRTQRTFGEYQDIASWTAVLPPSLGGDRRIFGQPREVDQASLSFPLPWSGSSFGTSYVQTRNAENTRARIANLSFTQDLGRLALFASGVRDFEVRRSTSLYVGLSIPLGRRVTASAGATSSRGATSGYIEASEQGAHGPGSFGWSARASMGDEREAQAILRYSTDFARFEATSVYSAGTYSGTMLVEGALAFVGDGLHATPRLDDAFALVDVGAPGVTILRENHKVGVTGKSGKLLVPDLAPFIANRIALDPAGLPIDAKVGATQTTTTPFSRVASYVDMRVQTETHAALVTLVDAQNRPIELGSTVKVIGSDTDFIIGYEGQAYLEDLKKDVVLLVTTPDGTACGAHFRYASAPGEQVRIGPLACIPGQ